eukprot:2156670-Pleurochrysis_carterae.AAC.3
MEAMYWKLVSTDSCEARLHSLLPSTAGHGLMKHTCLYVINRCDGRQCKQPLCLRVCAARCACDDARAMPLARMSSSPSAVVPRTVLCLDLPGGC